MVVMFIFRVTMMAVRMIMPKIHSSQWTASGSADSIASYASVGKRILMYFVKERAKLLVTDTQLF